MENDNDTIVSARNVPWTHGGQLRFGSLSLTSCLRKADSHYVFLRQRKTSGTQRLSAVLQYVSAYIDANDGGVFETRGKMWFTLPACFLTREKPPQVPQGKYKESVTKQLGRVTLPAMPLNNKPSNGH